MVQKKLQGLHWHFARTLYVVLENQESQRTACRNGHEHKGNNIQTAIRQYRIFHNRIQASCTYHTYRIQAKICHTPKTRLNHHLLLHCHTCDYNIKKQNTCIINYNLNVIIWNIFAHVLLYLHNCRLQSCIDLNNQHTYKPKKVHNEDIKISFFPGSPDNSCHSRKQRHKDFQHLRNILQWRT